MVITSIWDVFRPYPIIQPKSGVQVLAERDWNTCHRCQLQSQSSSLVIIFWERRTVQLNFLFWESSVAMTGLFQWPQMLEQAAWEYGILIKWITLKTSAFLLCFYPSPGVFSMLISEIPTIWTSPIFFLYYFSIDSLMCHWALSRLFCFVNNISIDRCSLTYKDLHPNKPLLSWKYYK